MWISWWVPVMHFWYISLIVPTDHCICVFVFCITCITCISTLNTTLNIMTGIVVNKEEHWYQHQYSTQHLSTDITCITCITCVSQLKTWEHWNWHCCIDCLPELCQMHIILCTCCSKTFKVYSMEQFHNRRGWKGVTHLHI